MGLYKYESNETFSEIFEIINDKIANIVQEMDQKDNFEMLAKMYFSLLGQLKKKAGTSQGFTGFAEYIILKAILLYLEQKQGIMFETRPKTGEKEDTTYFFISKDKHIIITHAFSIDKNMERAVRRETGKEIEWSKEAEKLCPDIVIFKEEDGRYKPVAVIQIKIYKVNPKVIHDEERKIKKMCSNIESGKPLSCIIFLTKQSDENKIQEFDYVITPENQKFREMLQKISVLVNKRA